MEEVQAARTLYDYVRDGGILGCLVFFIWGGFKQYWVFGTTLTRERFLLEQQRDQLLAERNEWKRIALQSTAIADKVVDHAAQVQKQIA